MKYKVTVPRKGARLADADTFTLDETEVKPWFEMFLADTSLGETFSMQRVSS